MSYLDRRRRDVERRGRLSFARWRYAKKMNKKRQRDAAAEWFEIFGSTDPSTSSGNTIKLKFSKPTRRLRHSLANPDRVPLSSRGYLTCPSVESLHSTVTTVSDEAYKDSHQLFSNTDSTWRNTSSGTICGILCDSTTQTDPVRVEKIGAIFARFRRSLSEKRSEDKRGRDAHCACRVAKFDKVVETDHERKPALQHHAEFTRNAERGGDKPPRRLSHDRSLSGAYPRKVGRQGVPVPYAHSTAKRSSSDSGRTRTVATQLMRTMQDLAVQAEQPRPLRSSHVQATSKNSDTCVQVKFHQSSIGSQHSDAHPKKANFCGLVMPIQPVLSDVAIEARIRAHTEAISTQIEDLVILKETGVVFSVESSEFGMSSSRLTEDVSCYTEPLLISIDTNTDDKFTAPSNRSSDTHVTSIDSSLKTCHRDFECMAQILPIKDEASIFVQVKPTSKDQAQPVGDEMEQKTVDAQSSWRCMGDGWKPGQSSLKPAQCSAASQVYDLCKLRDFTSMTNVASPNYHYNSHTQTDAAELTIWCDVALCHQYSTGVKETQVGEEVVQPSKLSFEASCQPEYSSVTSQTSAIQDFVIDSTSCRVIDCTVELACKGIQLSTVAEHCEMVCQSIVSYNHQETETVGQLRRKIPISIHKECLTEGTMLREICCSSGEQDRILLNASSTSYAVQHGRPCSSNSSQTEPPSRIQSSEFSCQMSATLRNVNSTFVRPTAVQAISYFISTKNFDSQAECSTSTSIEQLNQPFSSQEEESSSFFLPAELDQFFDAMRNHIQTQTTCVAIRDCSTSHQVAGHSIPCQMDKVATRSIGNHREINREDKASGHKLEHTQEAQEKAVQMTPQSASVGSQPAGSVVCVVGASKEDSKSTCRTYSSASLAQPHETRVTQTAPLSNVDRLTGHSHPATCEFGTQPSHAASMHESCSSELHKHQSHASTDCDDHLTHANVASQQEGILAEDKCIGNHARFQHRTVTASYSGEPTTECSTQSDEVVLQHRSCQNRYLLSEQPAGFITDAVHTCIQTQLVAQQSHATQVDSLRGLVESASCYSLHTSSMLVQAKGGERRADFASQAAHQPQISTAHSQTQENQAQLGSSHFEPRQVSLHSQVEGDLQIDAQSIFSMVTTNFSSQPIPSDVAHRRLSPIKLDQLVECNSAFKPASSAVSSQAQLLQSQHGSARFFMPTRENFTDHNAKRAHEVGTEKPFFSEDKSSQQFYQATEQYSTYMRKSVDRSTELAITTNELATHVKPIMKEKHSSLSTLTTDTFQQETMLCLDRGIQTIDGPQQINSSASNAIRQQDSSGQFEIAWSSVAMQTKIAERRESSQQVFQLLGEHIEEASVQAASLRTDATTQQSLFTPEAREFAASPFILSERTALPAAMQTEETKTRNMRTQVDTIRADNDTQTVHVETVHSAEQSSVELADRMCQIPLNVLSFDAQISPVCVSTSEAGTQLRNACEETPCQTEILTAMIMDEILIVNGVSSVAIESQTNPTVRHCRLQARPTTTETIGTQLAIATEDSAIQKTVEMEPKIDQRIQATNDLVDACTAPVEVGRDSTGLQFSPSQVEKQTEVAVTCSSKSTQHMIDREAFTQQVRPVGNTFGSQFDLRLLNRLAETQCSLGRERQADMATQMQKDKQEASQDYSDLSEAITQIGIFKTESCTQSEKICRSTGFQVDVHANSAPAKKNPQPAPSDTRTASIQISFQTLCSESQTASPPSYRERTVDDISDSALITRNTVIIHKTDSPTKVRKDQHAYQVGRAAVHFNASDVLKSSIKVPEMTDKCRLNFTSTCSKLETTFNSTQTEPKSYLNKKCQCRKLPRQRSEASFQTEAPQHQDAQTESPSPTVPEVSAESKRARKTAEFSSVTDAETCHSEPCCYCGMSAPKLTSVYPVEISVRPCSAKREIVQLPPPFPFKSRIEDGRVIRHELDAWDAAAIHCHTDSMSDFCSATSADLPFDSGSLFSERLSDSRQKSLSGRRSCPDGLNNLTVSFENGSALSDQSCHCKTFDSGVESHLPKPIPVVVSNGPKHSFRFRNLEQATTQVKPRDIYLAMDLKPGRMLDLVDGRLSRRRIRPHELDGSSEFSVSRVFSNTPSQLDFLDIDEEELIGVTCFDCPTQVSPTFAEDLGVQAAAEQCEVGLVTELRGPSRSVMTQVGTIVKNFETQARMSMTKLSVAIQQGVNGKDFQVQVRPPSADRVQPKFDRSETTVPSGSSFWVDPEIDGNHHNRQRPFRRRRLLSEGHYPLGGNESGTIQHN